MGVHVASFVCIFSTVILLVSMKPVNKQKDYFEIFEIFGEDEKQAAVYFKEYDRLNFRKFGVDYASKRQLKLTSNDKKGSSGLQHDDLKDIFVGILKSRKFIPETVFSVKDKIKYVSRDDDGHTIQPLAADSWTKTNMVIDSLHETSLAQKVTAQILRDDVNKQSLVNHFLIKTKLSGYLGFILFNQCDLMQNPNEFCNQVFQKSANYVHTAIQRSDQIKKSSKSRSKRQSRRKQLSKDRKEVNQSPHGKEDNQSPHGKEDNPSPHGKEDNPSPHGKEDNPSPHGKEDNPSRHGKEDNRSPHGTHTRTDEEEKNSSRHEDETSVNAFTPSCQEQCYFQRITTIKRDDMLSVSKTNNVYHGRHKVHNCSCDILCFKRGSCCHDIDTHCPKVRRYAENMLHIDDLEKHAVCDNVTSVYVITSCPVDAEISTISETEQMR